MSPSPTIQILERADYTKQHIVSLPNALPYPSLPASSIRVQSRIISLTTNNFTYARIGHLVGWWDVHPLHPSTPAPYNDPQKYGCISAWGYAEIIDSTVPELPIGKTIFGYIPIGTLPTDIEVEVKGTKKTLIWVTSQYRKHLWPIYNLYQLYPSVSELEKAAGSKDSLGWDSLMQVLFGTSYNLNDYGLAWDPKKLIHPSGELSAPWTLSDANLADSVVVILSASGKTALAFAHQLRHNRPKDQQPKSIIGVCSSTSKASVEKCGFYDEVLLYNDTAAAKTTIHSSKPNKIILAEFGAREHVMPAWHTALSSLSIPYQFLGIGSEVKQASKEEILQNMQKSQGMGRVQVNASGLREKALALGGDDYLEEFYAAWEGFKQDGAVPGMKLQWGDGMEDWARAWEMLVKDEISPDRGLVFTL